MNKADPLMASLRQIPTGKVVLRPGQNMIGGAKDGKNGTEQFREQLRLLALGIKPGDKAEEAGTDKVDLEKTGSDTAQRLERDAIADIVEDLSAGLKPRDEQQDKTLHHTAPDASATITEWRGPEAALSAAMSRLDHAQKHITHSDEKPSRVSQAQLDARPDTAQLDLAIPAEKPGTDGSSGPRFAVSVEAASPRAVTVAKAVVRDQETHFEPVPQLTQLQKIVDRMATDLTSVATQSSSPSADVAASDIQHVADNKPLRMLTLELDPPNLGAVTVKMRMTGDSVEVHLSADRYETTQMLRQERGALTELMQSAGYAFDIAAIDHTRASDSGLGGNQQQSQSDQRPSQQSAGGSQFENGNSGRPASDGQGGARQNRQGHEQLTDVAEQCQDRPQIRPGTGGAVYL